MNRLLDQNCIAGSPIAVAWLADRADIAKRFPTVQAVMTLNVCWRQEPEVFREYPG
jgi:hypothetical protein